MEAAAGKKTINVLRRLIAYSEKIFRFSRDVIAANLGQENGTAYLYGGRNEVRDGVVLGQAGQRLSLLLTDPGIVFRSYWDYLLAA